MNLEKPINILYVIEILRNEKFLFNQWRFQKLSKYNWSFQVLGSLCKILTVFEEIEEIYSAILIDSCD